MWIQRLLILYIFSLKMEFKFKLQNKEVLENNGRFIIQEEKGQSCLLNVVILQRKQTKALLYISEVKRATPLFTERHPLKCFRV